MGAIKREVTVTRAKTKEHYYAVICGNDGITVRVRVNAMPIASRAGDRILDHLSQSIEPLKIVFVGEPWP